MNYDIEIAVFIGKSLLKFFIVNI